MAEVDIGTADGKIEDFITKYSNMSSPNFGVSIDGTNLVEKGVLINYVEVETNTLKADSFSFTVFNAYDTETGEFKWVDEYFTPGKYIEIKLGYETTLEPVFYGLITCVAIRFPPGIAAEVIVSGMDVSFKMMKGTKSISWTKKKHSDVVKTIAASYSLKVNVTDTPVSYELVEQSRVSDYQFISWLAAKNNMEFFVTGKSLYFRKYYGVKTPVVTIDMDVFDIFIEVIKDIAEQTGDIVVRGWDSKKKEEIEAKSTSVDKLNSNGKTGQGIIKEICTANPTEYYYADLESKEDGVQMANSILNKCAMKLISGSGECPGIPEIRAGKYIKITGATKVLNKLYYIVSSKHVLDVNGFKTSFELGGNTL